MIFEKELDLCDFYVPYRWWEDEATMVLWTFNVNEIRDLLQYRLYYSDFFARDILRSRNEGTVADFATTLLVEKDLYPVSMTHNGKVDIILLLSQPTYGVPRPWSWYPTRSFTTNDARQLADEIDAESENQFKEIQFEDWVQFSLGYSTSSVDWFLVQHRDLYFSLITHLNSFPDQIGLYLEVEKVCETWYLLSYPEH